MNVIEDQPDTQPNAIRLTHLPFGCTEDDLKGPLNQVLAFKWTLEWPEGNDSVVVIPQSDRYSTAQDMSRRVVLCVPLLRQTFQRAGSTIRVELCRVNEQGRLLVPLENMQGTRPAVNHRLVKLAPLFQANVQQRSPVAFGTHNPFSALSTSPPTHPPQSTKPRMPPGLEINKVQTTPAESTLKTTLAVVEDWMDLADDL